MLRFLLILEKSNILYLVYSNCCNINFNKLKSIGPIRKKEYAHVATLITNTHLAANTEEVGQPMTRKYMH